MNTLASIRSLPPLANPGLVSPSGGLTGAIRPAELQELSQVASPAATPASKATSGDGSFSSLLGRMVTEVNAKQNAAGQAVADLQAGKPVTLHQAMISMEEASISFQLMAEVRNRLLESYQELMRMQV